MLRREWARRRISPANCLRCWLASTWFTPYPGAQGALTDLIGGRVEATFNSLPSVLVHVRSGALRALGVTSTTRAETMADVPPISDFVPGYEAIGWYGVGAPSGTPEDILEMLHREVNVALDDPTIKARIVDLGASQMRMTRPEFNKFMADDVGRWAKVVKAANIKAE